MNRRLSDRAHRLAPHSEEAGRPLTAMDGLIAATATVHDLTLVTRNVSDFEATLKVILNPWN